MMTDRTVGRYVIKKEIGQGGMATVYLASDPRFERDVAIKILPSHFLHDIRFRARFEREARIVAGLQHPAIVPVYDFGEDQGQPYLVMALMTGGSLEERLREEPLSPIEIDRIIGRLAPALDAAHKRGVIHRDLKPGNILFDQWDEPYLTDFGIVKLTEGDATMLTTTGGIIGTPAYMSPEQVQGIEIDGRSDIYALGVILFQMLTRQLPYNATTPIGLAYKHVIEPIPQLQLLKNDLPDSYQAVIDKAMAKQPADRYQTAGEMAKELHRVVNGTEPQLGIPVMAPVGPTVAVTPERASPTPAVTTPVSVQKPATPRVQEPTAQIANLASKPDLTESETAVLSPSASRRRGLPIWVWGLLALLLVGGGFALFQLFGAADTNEELTPAAVVAGAAGGGHVKATATLPATAVANPVGVAGQAQMAATERATSAPAASPLPTVIVETPQTALASREAATAAPVKTAAVIVTDTPVTPQVRVIPASVNIRSGPGTAYAAVSRAEQGDILDVIGRNEQVTWYNIVKDDERGWIAADVVEPLDEAALSTVPVAGTIPAPPPTATSLPTATPLPPTAPPVATQPPGGGDEEPAPPPQPTEPPTPAPPPD
jgi:serine/threonine protein kinase/uncharacterized protein YraI